MNTLRRITDIEIHWTKSRCEKNTDTVLHSMGNSGRVWAANFSYETMLRTEKPRKATSMWTCNRVNLFFAVVLVLLVNRVKSTFFFVKITKQLHFLQKITIFNAVVFLPILFSFKCYFSAETIPKTITQIRVESENDLLSCYVSYAFTLQIFLSHRKSNYYIRNLFHHKSASHD